jgi:hypothetical protein
MHTDQTFGNSFFSISEYDEVKDFINKGPGKSYHELLDKVKQQATNKIYEMESKSNILSPSSQTRNN